MEEELMSVTEYECDACGASFEVDSGDARFEYGVFCPECGETELIKSLDDENCEPEQVNPVAKTRR
jgi:DNA-directed RNA polymerase subunit RPC12/RpoP